MYPKVKYKTPIFLAEPEELSKSVVVSGPVSISKNSFPKSKKPKQRFSPTPSTSSSSEIQRISNGTYTIARFKKFFYMLYIHIYISMFSLFTFRFLQIFSLF